MKRLLTSAALVFVGTAVMLAQTGTGTRAPSVDARPCAVGRTRRSANGVAGGRSGEASRLVEQELRRLS